MTTYKLTYFDMDWGRAAPIRLAFHLAGIEFEDHRISFDEFRETRDAFRFTCVPVLEIDGQPVTQSNAISRYVGKLGGLYPEDPLQALYCDEVLGALDDLTGHIVRTFGLTGEALREAREQLADGWLSLYLRGLDELLTRGGGEYFADGRLTIADLKTFTQMQALTSGVLEHLPKDLVGRVAPSLAEHAKRVAADSRVASYYASRAT